MFGSYFTPLEEALFDMEEKQIRVRKNHLEEIDELNKQISDLKYRLSIQNETINKIMQIILSQEEDKVKSDLIYGILFSED